MRAWSRYGVAAALEALARVSAIPVKIDEDVPVRFSDSFESTAYFCCLEALQNAAEHAGPSATATVRLLGTEAGLRFAVTDDGDGFDLEARDMITVAIADDSYLVREALQQIIGRSEHLTLAAVCADGDELREVIARDPPDAVVTDLRMPPSGDGEGLAVARELRESHPEIAVIVLSQFAEPRIALELLEGGAERRGYLLKDHVADAGGLPAAIEAVAAGGTLIDPGMIVGLIGAASRSSDSPLGELSGREREVLALMAEGMSNAAIAERLVVTQRAVEKHVNAIFRKLRLRDEQLVSRRVMAVLLHLSG